ncbi:MAG: M10 family metallopeptidase C-terminal domain-containing protein, partial [Devosia sp.]
GFGNLNALSAVSLARNWTAQSTAANEAHLSSDFIVPLNADPASQSLSLDLLPTGTWFSLDHVSLTLNLIDADLDDLRIELTSAAGTTVVIAPNLNAAGGMTTLDFTFDSVATWGESPFGTWTVRLSHATASSSFSISDATLDFYGDFTNSDDIYYFTASYAALVAAQLSRTTIVDGDGGSNTLNFAAAADELTVDLGAANGHIGGTAFTLAGTFAKVVGSIHDDRIVGADQADHLIGDYGDDTLVGSAGADTLVGGPGTDTAAFAHAVSLDLTSGVHGGEAAGDIFSGLEIFALSDEVDTFVGNNARETVLGGAGDDAIDGRGGNDRLHGGLGADTMAGGMGKDMLDGKAGKDKLLGGIGSDTLTGGTDADILTGGAGRDHFVFSHIDDSKLRSFDLIKDFAHGKDKIDVSAIDANGKASGNTKFHFIGERNFSDKKGELAIDHTAKSTIILADIDGNGHADIKIVLAGHLNMTAGDFIL